jgi:hypothetical protein
MDKVTKRINGKKTIYPIYTEQEAIDKGIKYKPWRECSKGEYALSDDGYVGECIYVRSYSKARQKYANFAFGVSWVNKYSKILYEENKAYGTYGMVKPAQWQDREAKTLRAKQAVKAYVSQLVSDQPIDWNIIGNIYRPDQKTPAATVRRLFKEEKIKKMIDKKLEEVLVSKGITKEMVVQNNIDAFELAKAKGDPSIMHKINGSFEEYLGMKGAKQVVTDRIEMDITNKIEETIGAETEKRKLAIERKTEQPQTKSSSN